MSFWDFDTMLNMKDGDILFFDEVLNGNPTVLNACLTILEQRIMISGKKLPDIMIVAAANPQGMMPLTPQIKERFVWYRVNYDEDMYNEYMYNKYGMTPDIVKKLYALIRNEKFNMSDNFNTPRSFDKAVNMIINGVETPYENILLPILNTLIKNDTGEEVQLSEDKIMAVNESVPWLEIAKIRKNSK